MQPKQQLGKLFEKFFKTRHFPRALRCHFRFFLKKAVLSNIPISFNGEKKYGLLAFCFMMMPFLAGRSGFVVISLPLDQSLINADVSKMVNVQCQKGQAKYKEVLLSVLNISCPATSLTWSSLPGPKCISIYLSHVQYLSLVRISGLEMTVPSSCLYQL